MSGSSVPRFLGSEGAAAPEEPRTRESEEPQLRRTLGTGDLVLAQILLIVGLSSAGAAARLGSLQWVYWLLGIALFQVPLALVVLHLMRANPVEGGIYQWTRAAFGNFAGFMVAWNFWNFIILMLSTVAMQVAGGIGYAIGADEAWMSNRLWQVAINALVTILLMLLAIAGFGTSKWLYNIAAVALLIVGVMLIALPMINTNTRAEAPPIPLSLMQVVLFTRIAVYALAGFEAMAVVVGETRGGERSIARSIVIAFPCIGAIYILATRSVLNFVEPANVDLVNPLAQTFSIALRSAAPVVILLLAFRDFAQSSGAFSVITRMPLVAGWDHLVPAWFTKLHPRTKTPVNAILVSGALMFAYSVAAIAFAGRQEAFQTLLMAGGVLFATMYLVMFAIPLLRPASWWLRVAAASGFIVTAAFFALSFVPIVEVRSPLRYAATIATAIVAANAVGVGVFVTARRYHTQAGDSRHVSGTVGPNV